MAAIIVPRLPLLVFAICLVLMLFMTRMISRTKDSLIAGVHRQPVYKKEEIQFLHLVIQFPLLSNDTQLLRERQLEYMQTLQRNLAHPLVKRVHILCEDDQVIEFIRRHFTLNAQKLVLRNIGRRLFYSDALTYISTQLLFETSIITHADIYIGKGFEKLDPNILRQGTMYALTRREDREKIKSCPGIEDFCGPNVPYRGSHDAFVMHLVRPLPDEVLQKTNFRPNIAGAENAFIYMLKKYGPFRFRNPCSILHIIHNHCSMIRNNRTRYVHGQTAGEYLKIPAGLARFSGL